MTGLSPALSKRRAFMICVRNFTNQWSPRKVNSEAYKARGSKAWRTTKSLCQGESRNMRRRVQKGTTERIRSCKGALRSREPYTMVDPKSIPPSTIESPRTCNAWRSEAWVAQQADFRSSRDIQNSSIQDWTVMNPVANKPGDGATNSRLST